MTSKTRWPPKPQAIGVACSLPWWLRLHESNVPPVDIFEEHGALLVTHTHEPHPLPCTSTMSILEGTHRPRHAHTAQVYLFLFFCRLQTHVEVVEEVVVLAAPLVRQGLRRRILHVFGLDHPANKNKSTKNNVANGDEKTKHFCKEHYIQQ